MKKRFIVITTLLSMGLSTYLFSDSQPAISRLNGTPYAAGVPISQDAGTVGAVDTTFGSSGSVSLATELSGGQAKAIHVFDDGSMVVGLSKSASNSVVAKYTATGAVESSANFGTSGIADLGTTAPIYGMIVDELGRTVVCGGNTSGTTGFLKRVSADGDAVVSYDLSGNTWQFIGAVAQQSTGDYIVAGFDGTNARLARYTQGSASAAGALDTTFGASGFRTVPTSAAGLHNVYVHSDDTIFVAYGVSNTGNYDIYIRKFDANGSVVSGWGTSGDVQLTSLTAAQADLDLVQIRMVANANDLVVGVTKATGFYAESKTIAAAANGTFADVSFLTSDACTLRHMMVDANGKVYFVGSSTTDIKFALARATTAGVLDTAGFNSLGYNKFSVGTPDTAAVLYGASIAPDGRVFAAGYQVHSGTTTPYLSSVYGDQYVGQRAQFPASSEQGTFDEAFGSDESDDGIVRTFKGIYGSSLDQKARKIITLSDGHLLIAQDGKLDNSSNSNMVLTRLNGDGTADASFALAKTYTNEYITAVTQGVTGTYLYVTGYSSDGEVILRKYNNSAVLQWDLAVVEADQEDDYHLSGANYKAFGIALQAAGSGSRIILFKQVSATEGQMSAHLPASGILDTSFNAGGDAAGFISTADFSASLVNMGPIVGFTMDEHYDIYIAYKNSSTGYVDVAKINFDGSGLVDEFGTSGIVANVLGVVPTTVNDIGLVLDNQNRLIVAAANGTDYYVGALIASSGDADDSFGTSGVASFTSIGTATILKQVVTLDDNSILLVGSDNATDDSMVVMKLDSDGAYDTSFNAQGAVPGLALLQLTNTTTNYQSRVATGLAVNADGDFIVCGYEEPSAYESVPMAFKLHGESGRSQVAQFVQTGSQENIGTINTTYGTNGIYTLETAISNGSAKVVYSYPSGNTHQGKILVAVDGGTDTILARMYEHNMAFDTSFSGDGQITLSEKTGLETILVDADNKILLAGGNAGAAWITRVADNGGSQSVFSVPTGFKKVYDIKHQQSGRYIFAGTDTDDRGAVGALRDTGAVDTTFNPLGTVPGVYQFGAGITAVPSIAINEDDTILAAYKDTTVKIAQLNMHGSALVNGFGSSGVKNSSITPTDALAIRLALDSSAKVVLATSVGGTSVSLVRYTTAGATDGTFHSDGSVLSITGLGTAGVTLHRLIVDENDKMILLGENTDDTGANGPLYAVRVDEAGVLDATWNSSPTNPDVAGILTFDLGSATNAYDGTLFIDGTLYVAAYVSGQTTPALISIFGDDSSTEVDQQPYETAAGIIDTTLDATGSLNLNTAYGITGVAKSSHIFADGSQLIASSNGTNSYITKLKADFTLDATFGDSSSGIVTISGKDNISDMFVANGTDDDASIFVCGDDAGAMWAAKVSADGSTVTQVTVPSVSAGTTLTNGYVIRQSTNGRVLVGGVTTTSGVIAAFKSDLSGMDLSFGNGSGTGYYRTGDVNPIVDMVLDDNDRIYVARKDANAGSPIIKVQRLYANGTGVDTDFGSGSIEISQTSSLVGTSVRCALDANNDQFVVAVQDGTTINNVWKVRRYAVTDGTAQGSLDTVTIAGKLINLRSLLIDSDEYMYASGFNSTDGYGVVARIESTNSTTINLDTDFATTGIANLNTGSMTVVSCASLHPDRRIRLYGQNGGAGIIAYAGRVFGDVYTSQVTEEIFRAQDGAVDLTIDAGDNGVVALQDVWAGLNSVYAVHALADGSLLFATGNGTNLVIAKSNADVNPDTSFNTTGLTTAVSFVTVDSMIVDADGKIVVSGTGAANAQKVVRFSSVGAVDTIFSSSLSCTYGNQVLEQKSGRYLVAGYKGSSGAVNAYRSTGVDDSTYGPAANAGWYATGVNAVVQDMVLDANDNAYIAYIDTTVKLEKISANGSQKDATFGSGAAVNTGISGTGVVKLAINAAGNILVAATTASGVQTRLYNGSTGAAIEAAQTITDANTPVLGDVAVAHNDFVVAVYTTTVGSKSVKVIRLLAANGTVDSSFGTSGVTVTTGEDAAFAYGITVRPDGRILVGGANMNNEPIAFQVYGDSYVAQTEQFPGKEAAGLLDTTFYPTSGALNLDDRVSVTGLDGSSVKRMYEYGDGRMLLVCENGSDTIVMRLAKDLTLDTSFNTVGYLTITGKVTARGLFVDADGQIFVAGGSSTSWVRAYTSAGAALPGWVTPTQNLSGGAYEILQQSCERTILAGKNTNGTLYGYTVGGILDQSFGTSGEVNTGVAYPIADMSIDSLDRILIVHVDGSGNSVLKRVSADGDTITTLSGTALTNVSGDKLRVVQDLSGNIIVGAATTTGFALRCYDADGTDRSGSSLITINTGVNTMEIANLYTTSDGKTVLVGYNTTNNNIMIARINSAFSALDTAFNGGAVLSTTIGNMNVVYDAIIHADNRIMLGGGSTISADPFLARVFGDSYVTTTNQFRAEGVAGVIDTTHGTSGALNYLATGINFGTSTGKALLTIADGGHYLAIDNASGSKIVKMTSSNTLDTSFNTDGYADDAPAGVYTMIMDGSDRLVAVGTNGSSEGWIYRLDASGDADTSFGSTGVASVASASFNAVVELSLGRLVVAGKRTNGCLRAYTDAGVLDTTFNSLGSTPGEYALSGNTNGIYAMVADEYDQLIVAVLNAAGNAVDLMRFRSSGVLDTSFGTNGVIAGAISGGNSESDIRLLINPAGNIVLAARISDAGSNKIAIKTFDNLVASSGNGAVVNAQLTISSASLTSPSLKNMIVDADGYVYLLGGQNGTSGNIWIARLLISGTDAVALDTVGFNPNGVAVEKGIFKHAKGMASAHTYSGISIRYDGRLSILGSADNSVQLLRVYNTPYTSQEDQFPGIMATGTNDLTFGRAGQNSIEFYALAGTDADEDQVARAVSMPDNNNYLIALDGQSTADDTSRVFLNMFNIDGTLNTTFNTTGQQELLSSTYENKYVNDMVTFTTVDSVQKALVAGYVYNSTLSVYNSLLLQYNIDSEGLDSTFGGFDGDPSGVAFGDGKRMNVVGRQTTGRVITGGLDQSDYGLVLGFTADGKLDQSFGSDGYFVQGSTGVYAMAVTSTNKIVVAYNDGSNNVAVAQILADGSGLDTAFSSDGIVNEADRISGISGNTNLRVALRTDDKIIAAAVNNSGADCVLKKYSTTGSLETSLTVASAALGTVTNLVISRMLLDTNNNIVVAAYGTIGGAQKIIVFRVLADLSGLDTAAFNSPSGYVAYTTGEAQTPIHMLIQDDGRITIVGSHA